MSDTTLIQGGTVYDGLGGPGQRADLLVDGDRIGAVVPPTDEPAAVDVLDATGCAVAPGFINILSHAYGTLQQDGRGLSDLRQGVTTEVFGEGLSLGPLTEELAELVLGQLVEHSGVRHWWPRLADFLTSLQSRGVAPNVASFVGAHNLRMSQAGADNRPLTGQELARAKALLNEELADGALGVGSALIYPPGSYASTEELVEYARVIAEHDGLYISHIRSEGDRLLEGVREVLTIAERSGVRSEIYHLKAVGKANWPQLSDAIHEINEARAKGLAVTADVYPYTAGMTALHAVIPPVLHDGGAPALLGRLRDHGFRAEVKRQIRTHEGDWENLYQAAGGGTGILLLADLADGRPYGGMTLTQIAAAQGQADELDTLIDLVLAEPDLEAAYFMGHTDNIRMALRQPWVSVGSDSEAISVELAEHVPVHPRAYGAFARILGRYVREEGVLSLAEAIRRMTSLPADVLRLRGRGQLTVGSYADVVVFDPQTINDHATYAQPHQYATGVRHVVVNGVVALRDGEPTGALPGRALRRG
ncbi:N-acyl-D-amino-acid deacylase family protein [Actinocrispum wychmicini]|uniref:N-acyl-D-amino-acid deacylase n=1 Tax=Actinocrispum wychmicini TaxID=1213861 RepID=A0A4R2J7N7_9PSEU|nr:amidohydrolase family protein [Actinocrispum wychmicini]TCO54167.1 N-acyl-D-amino-acid deacylase [Actinocrispum wychmicini]